MFQIEIEIDPADGDAFDTVLWRFCAERCRFEPKVKVRPSNLGRSEQRILTFKDPPDGMAFRRQWWLFEDGRVDRDRNSYGPLCLGNSLEV